MKLRNIALLSVFAVSANAGFEFKVSGFGGVANKKSEMHSAIAIAQVAAVANASTVTVGGITYPGENKGANAVAALLVYGHAASIQAKADKSKKGFFGLLMGEATMKHSAMHFGAFAGVLFSNASPKQVAQDFAVGAAGTAGEGVVTFKNRGVMLMVGPKVGMHKGAFAVAAGVALTLSSNRINFKDASAAPDTTDISLQNKMFRTIGGMPFVTVSYKIGEAEVSGFVGHNFSKKPTLKNKSTAVDPQGDGTAAAGSLMSQYVYNLGANAGLKVKQSTTYFGVGVSMKLS